MKNMLGSEIRQARACSHSSYEKLIEEFMARDSKMLLHNLKINLSKLRFGDYSFLRLPKQQFSRRGHTQVRRWERFKTFSTEVDLAGSAQNQVQLFCKLYMQMCILQTNIVTLSQTGSGCGSAGRAVAFDTRGLRFESSHQQNLH